MPAMPRQGAAEFSHGLQIVDRSQFVNVRQHDFDAAGLRLEALKPQQWVEPNEPPARAVQPVDFEAEPYVRIALQPIRE